MVKKWRLILFVVGLLSLPLFGQFSQARYNEGERKDYGKETIHYGIHPVKTKNIEQRTLYSRLLQRIWRYDYFPGLVVVHLDKEVYKRYPHRELYGKLKFRIKRVHEECFERVRSGQECIDAIECEVQPTFFFLMCPLIEYDEETKNYNLLLREKAESFQIEAVVYFEKAVSRKEIHEVVETSPELTIDRILNGR